MREPTIEDRLFARAKPQAIPVLHMQWKRLLFLHWAWSAKEVQDTLPRGLFVDTFDHQAWLGIVPFFMRRVRPSGLPPVPWLSNFLELNVRTYVHDGAGVPGVWFYSLVCNQPLAVEIARRGFNLNYVHARMSAHIGPDGTCAYKARRLGYPEAEFRYGSRKPPLATEPGSLEFFLVERYVMFSADRQRRLHAGKVFHLPYRIAQAEVEKWSFVPAVADRFKDPSAPADHAVVAEKLDVEAWPIRPHPHAG